MAKRKTKRLPRKGKRDRSKWCGQGQPRLTARWPPVVAFTFGLRHEFEFAGTLESIRPAAKLDPRGAAVLRYRRR
jgi:hypothetical protein